MCRNFFDHPGHLASHFSWLSNVDSLEIVVEENLYKQIGKTIYSLNLDFIMEIVVNY